MFLTNLLLALAWMALTGQFTATNFLFGFGLAFGLLWIFGRLGSGENNDGQSFYVRKVVQLVEFIGFFIKELVQANVRVAIDVLRWQPKMAPALLAVPLDLHTKEEITLLASLITLTPGTISVDIQSNQRAASVEDTLSDQNPGSDQRQPNHVLYVHAMHAGRTPTEIEQFRRSIKTDYERRVQEVMRWRP